MKVQELLDCKDKWIQKSYAQKAYAIDKDDEPVLYDSSDAVKWSLSGAINKCYPIKRWRIMDRIEEITGISVGKFNDTRSYEEVMELVRRLDI